MLSNIINALVPELKFGDFTFEHLEHFGAMPWGGTQNLVVHELIGGVRKVSAMGRSDTMITFTGIFEGINARDRAQYINTLRIQAIEQTLTWENFSYQAVIHSFTCSDEGPKWPFTISFLTIQDNTNPVTVAYPAFFDDVIFNYMDLALGIANVVGDPTILTPLNVLNGLFNTFPQRTGPTNTQAQQALQQTNTVISAVQASQSNAVSQFQSITQNTTSSGSTSTQPQSITQNYDQLTPNIELQAQLNQLNAICTIMAKDLTLYISPSDPNKVWVSNGDLFQLAVQYYGDELLWTAIAEANNLYDPIVEGIVQLIIPQNPGTSTGGVLAQ